MSLRLKLAVAMVALAVGSAVAVGSASYVSTGNQLRDRVDRSLDDAARRLVDSPGAVTGHLRPGRDGRPRGFRSFTQILVQLLDREGAVVAFDEIELPVGVPERAAASRDAPRLVRRDVVIEGEQFRMLTVGTGDGAVQTARSLEETERVLNRILHRTLLIVVVLAALGLLLGVVIAQQITRRLVRLTDAATRVTESGDLDVAVPVEGSDEAGQLGHAFNDMLASLARAKRAQHQLVQDAGHELRTPLTSLRTNVAVMQRYAELSPESQRQLLADVDNETRELTALVDELMELATERRDLEAPEAVSVGSVTEAVADRARRRTGRDVTVTAADVEVVVRPQALERALSNLVENALKFSDGPVDVVVGTAVESGAEGVRVEVRDRGPGIAEDDLVRVFDRFYRAEWARPRPGSGLGLAIVRDMAEMHGGTVFAANREGGGAVIGFQLPAQVRAR